MTSVMGGARIFAVWGQRGGRAKGKGKGTEGKWATGHFFVFGDMWEAAQRG